MSRLFAFGAGKIPGVYKTNMITPDEIIRTKRRSIALIVERDGRLIVRAPKRASSASIEELLAHKEKWIRSKQALAKKNIHDAQAQGVCQR